MYVCMKALDARGEEIIVEYLIDGWVTQYVGPRSGEHLFKTWDDPQKLLNVWLERVASVDPNWQQHLTVQLGS